MTHMRYYWAVTLAAAAAGGFIALTKFAFTPNHAIWIGFGVAVAAGVTSLAGTALALGRQNHRLSGLSAVSMLIAGFTIIATRAFTGSTALWLAFAGGLALLLVSLQSLAMHEAETERVVRSLEVNGSGKAVAAHEGQAAAAPSLGPVRDELQLPAQMRSWMHWITHTTVGIAGGFVVLTTFAWRNPVPGVQPHWVWAGAGIAAASVALLALGEHVLTAYNKGLNVARAVAIAVTAAAVAVSGALVAAMALHANIDYRWIAFALGAAMVGVSLVASVIHELTTERTYQRLEVVHAAVATQEVATAA
jgi:hypothetical protein